MSTLLQYLSIGGAVLILDDIGSVSGSGLTLDPALGGPTRSVIRESGPGLAIIKESALTRPGPALGNTLRLKTTPMTVT